MSRVVADTEVGGVTIPAGAQVLPSIGAANRDPRRFDHPEEFDVDRYPTSDLSFPRGLAILPVSVRPR